MTRQDHPPPTGGVSIFKNYNEALDFSADRRLKKMHCKCAEKSPVDVVGSVTLLLFRIRC